VRRKKVRDKGEGRGRWGIRLRRREVRKKGEGGRR
jgi:hypothetical protein